MGNNEIVIPDEAIVNKIYLIRGQKVMLDHDIAVLYGVETRRLNEQVKRNHLRFPDSFMFKLTNDEYMHLKSQNATSSWGGRRKLPYAFTEHGILMLANVLKSERAIKVSIRLIEVFVKIREFFLSRRDIEIRLEKAEGSLEKHEGLILEILKYIRQIEKEKQEQRDQNNRTKIGFKTSKDETGNG
ncbi:MAG: ORF6N domain-containing protein [Bacteroidales bacterium]|nr:ORF6N domain-containing protein [Bacteroidales bacterium]